MTQCHQGANDAPQRGNRVANRNAGAHGRAIFKAGDVAQPAHGLTHRAKTGLVFHGSGLAKARQTHHDQFRVQGVQHVPAQAQFFQYAGAEVLDQDVGLGQQLLEDVQAIGVLEVQRQGFLVTRLHEPPQRRTFIQLAPFTQGIAAIG